MSHRYRPMDVPLPHSGVTPRNFTTLKLTTFVLIPHSRIIIKPTCHHYCNADRYIEKNRVVNDNRNPYSSRGDILSLTGVSVNV